MTLGVLITSWLARAPKAYALDRDVKAILITSTYGMVAGTALGLAAFPMTKSTRMILVGSSIGLYLGIAVGVYFIQNRNSPDNPFGQPPDQVPPWMHRRSSFNSNETLSGLSESSGVLDYYAKRPDYALSLQVYSF